MGLQSTEIREERKSKSIGRQQRACSHGPVGRLPSVKSSVDLDRPQAGGYKGLSNRSGRDIFLRAFCEAQFYAAK